MTTPYTAEAVSTQDKITDIRIHIDGKTWHLWGRNGIAREASLANGVPDNTLPVLIGSGLGHCLKILAESGRPVAVIDKEETINQVSHVRECLDDAPNVLWLSSDNPQNTLDTLTRWQADNGGTPFMPVVLSLYLRLDRPYYGTLSETLKANAKGDFWSQTRYPKFETAKPRILFFDSSYFLCGEILSSLERLEMEFRTIELDQSGTGTGEFIETLLKAVVDFRPDFVLTVNHFGMDREGKLAGLLEKLNLPLASWFVDNPHLILHQYAHPGTANTAIFTYDAGNLDQMRAKGFENVHYLPLATDPKRFKPELTKTAPQQWNSDVSFVGNSMTTPVANSLKDSALPEPWRTQYEDIATQFEQSGSLGVEDYLHKYQPDWAAALDNLPTQENKLALESLITWEATRQYRLTCIRQIMPFAPLIVGDDGWKELLADNSDWRHLPGIDYYEDLPRFYPQSKINFNCTSSQMKGAVNQRIFDVPACGGFVLTDYRNQMEDLFDLETEVVVFHDPKEIPELIKKYLSDEKKRESITAAAQKHILAEHTYEHRLEQLISFMRRTFC